jgi:hypothetical protein
MLVAHLPDSTWNLPVDPWYLQTEALEHKHGFRKLWSFLMNHHAPKELEDRAAGYMYYRNGKFIWGKKDKKTDTCRNYMYQIVA